MADNEQPEHKHIERASAPPPPAPPPGADPEQYRQFEQFQQFQQFLQFQQAQQAQQAQQGSGVPPTAPVVPYAPPPPPPPRPPAWKRVLFSRVVQRLVGKLVTLLVVVLLLVWAYNHFFGTDDADDGTVGGRAGPGRLSDPNRPAGNPRELIMTVYNNTAQGQREKFDVGVCIMFEKNAGQQFASAFGAATCEEAVRGLAGKVAPLQVNPSIDAAQPGPITISSCEDLRLRPGSRGLGRFTLSRFGDGWIVTRHEPEPDPCPTPTTATGSPAPTTS